MKSRVWRIGLFAVVAFLLLILYLRHYYEGNLSVDPGPPVLEVR